MKFLAGVGIGCIWQTLVWTAATAAVGLAQGEAPLAAEAAARAPAAIVRMPVLPEAVASFGACRSGGWVYVYGGHVGREHAHSRANVRGSFQRLNLADGASWQTLPTGPALQGTALVAASDGALFRIGGMTANNEPDADADLVSTASVARFEPCRGTWEEVTPLPEPRSSHDAIVLDDRVYVVGGWQLAGGDEGAWLDTAWVADLRRNPLVWEPLPALDEPRRAAAVATFAGKVVVLGGIGPEGRLDSVQVFDPSTQRWSAGPALPGQAFGTAALGIGTRLFATVADGRLLAWPGTGAWQPTAQLEVPRFFHRMVPAADGGILVLGGAGRGGHMRSTEVVDIDGSAGVAVREYVIPAPGRVAYRQTLLLRDNTLWAFGGNRDTAPDRFAQEQFADDVWRIDLLQQTAERVAALPTGRQSMAATSWGDALDNILLGGLGVDERGEVRTLATTYRWDPRAALLQPFADLPAPRTQCHVVHHGGKLWVLGGTDFQPDGDGGSERGDACEVWVCDANAASPKFAAADVRLPRPRRSFGAAVLGGQLLLLGGLDQDFHAAGPGDVLDFATGTWSELPTPVPWVSPQVAVIGDRLYVACGGTMNGRRFTADPSVWSWRAAEGWCRTVDALPFPVRHVQMLAWRNRLLFYAANDARGDRIVLHTLEPDHRTHVLEAAMRR